MEAKPLEQVLRKLSNAIALGEDRYAVEAIGEYYQRRLKGEAEPEEGDIRAALMVSMLMEEL